MATEPGPRRTRGTGFRVAMVIQRFRPQFSGQGEQVELLSRVLGAKGIAPTIITSAYGEPSSRETCEGYQVVRLTPGLTRFRRSGGLGRLRGPSFGLRVLAHLAREGPFDLVHVHALTDALYTSWLWCRARGRPLLFETTLIGADDPVSIMTRRDTLAWARRSLFSRCDGYVAISPALESRFHEAGLGHGKVRMLPQGVDITRFRPAADRRAQRVSLGLPPSGAMLVFVGSLIHRKGIDLLLRAWAHVHRAHQDAHLVLVGLSRFESDPGATDFLRAQKAMLPADAARHIHELGVRNDVHRLLQAADLFVFPSRREGFGTVMIEAMACGLPCVVAEQPGITDFIFGSQRTCGVVVPQENPVAVATETCALLENPSRAEAIGLAARRRVVEQFDIEDIAERYIDFYQHLIMGRSGGDVGR